MSFDTHAAVKTLTAAGASEEIAVAVVDVAQEAAAEHGRELATRAGIAELRADVAAQREATRADTARLSVELAATRTDVETVRAGVEKVRETTRADIAEVREAARADARTIQASIETLRETTRADIAEVRAEQARMETRLIKWVVGTSLVVGALIVGVLRLLP